MTNSEIVTHNIDLIKLCCSHQARKYDTPPEFVDDIVQDVCITLLEYDNSKLNKIIDENHLNAFVTGILVRQLYSTNSAVYRTYRKLRELSNEVTEDIEPAVPKSKAKKEEPAEKVPYYPEDYDITEDDSELTEKIKKAVANLSPGERNIFLTYCETPNLTGLAKRLKVAPSLLRNYLNSIKNKIKEECIQTSSSLPLF